MDMCPREERERATLSARAAWVLESLQVARYGRPSLRKGSQIPMEHLAGPLPGLSRACASDSFATEASLTSHTSASECTVATLAMQREQE